MESLETFQDSSFSPDTTPNQMQVLLVSLKSALSFHPGTTNSALTLFCIQPPTSSLPLVYPSSCAGLSPLPELDLLNTNLIMPLPWLKSSTTAHSLTRGIILTATEAPNTDNTWLQPSIQSPCFPSPHPPPLSAPTTLHCVQSVPPKLLFSSVSHYRHLLLQKAFAALTCTHTWVRARSSLCLGT